VKAFHSTIKNIHLALEVKTFFSNSTPTMSYSTPGLPLTVVNDIVGKKRRRTAHKKLQKDAQ
jgi:hypothetical protein